MRALRLLAFVFASYGVTAVTPALACTAKAGETVSQLLARCAEAEVLEAPVADEYLKLLKHSEDARADLEAAAVNSSDPEILAVRVQL